MPTKSSARFRGERRSGAFSSGLEPMTMDEELDPGSLSAESIGRYLRRQRKLRDISVSQLADITRIPVRSIERLEAGHFDDDVDGFVRGFVRTVADALGLDPDDALTRMLAEPAGVSDSGRPVSLMLARGLVGLTCLVLVVIAFGVVRGVLQTEDDRAFTAGDASTVVWRSDPVRALAEAHTGHRNPTPSALQAPSKPQPPPDLRASAPASE